MSGGASTPCLITAAAEVPSVGEERVDEYLRFTASRVHPSTLIAQVYDLKVFFTVVAKAPEDVKVEDVLGFIESQRAPRRGGNVVRLADGEMGLAAATIKRRLATISSVFDYLVLRGLCDRNPVPRSMGARHRGHRGVPLVRAAKKVRGLRFATCTSATGGCSSPRARADIGAWHRVFVVLKGPRRGQPLSAVGLDEMLDGVRGFG